MGSNFAKRMAGLEKSPHPSNDEICSVIDGRLKVSKKIEFHLTSCDQCIKYSEYIVAISCSEIERTKTGPVLKINKKMFEEGIRRGSIVIRPMDLKKAHRAVYRVPVIPCEFC